jgi:hypothetical protein
MLPDALVARSRPNWLRSESMRVMLPKLFLIKWKWARYLILSFVLFSIFQSWETEYVSRLGRESDLRAANISRDYAVEGSRLAAKSNNTCQDALRLSGENEGKALTQSIQALSQTQASQSKVQECLVSLGRAQQRPIKEINTFFVGSVVNQGHPNTPSGTWVLTTNIPISPVMVTVDCGTKIVDANISIASKTGGGTQAEQTGSLPNGAYRANIQSPSWLPETPIIATLFFGTSQIQGCSFHVDQR